VVRASLTARSPATIFRSSRLRARRQFGSGTIKLARLNKRAPNVDASRGEEHEASSQGSKGKGWTIGLCEPQRDALIPPIEGQTGVGHQLVRGEPGRLLSRKDRGDNIGCEKGQPHNPRRIRSRDLLLPRDGLEGWTALSHLARKGCFDAPGRFSNRLHLLSPASPLR
jgi:hypothetical protein